MVRLKDIAERAGVSVMTVSKVLRNAPESSGGFIVVPPILGE